MLGVHNGGRARDTGGVVTGIEVAGNNQTGEVYEGESAENIFSRTMLFFPALT